MQPLTVRKATIVHNDHFFSDVIRNLSVQRSQHSIIGIVHWISLDAINCSRPSRNCSSTWHDVN